VEVLALSASKRIMVTVPENLLSEVDDLVSGGSKNRSEVIREAIWFYLRERKRGLFQEQMKKGYLSMAGINLEFVYKTYGVEEEALENGIEKLLE
jgi:CopG family transcriptional regulator/antitoxin EndoAI